MDSKEKKKKKWSDLPDSIMEIIQIVPSEPDVIHFTNIKTKPKKETLTPKQKAAWLRSQRPEYAEISYDDREVNPEAEASNNEIGELMDDLAIKTMSLQFEPREHIDEVLEQIKDMRTYVEDHMETYGTEEEMITALEILSDKETKAMNALKSRQKGEEAITSRKDL